METQINLSIGQKDKELIIKASERIALGYSTFCRNASVEKARTILKQFEDSETKQQVMEISQ